MIKFAPSILSADFAKLGEAIEIIKSSGADYAHIDVMDGHFVSNITLGHQIVEAIRPLSDVIFDVHLMIEEPRRQIENFARAGADIITIHAEASRHLHGDIGIIKKLGKKAGIAINPGTSLDSLEWILEDVDMVLLMTVNPGFGGQNYIKASTLKIEKLKNIILSRGLNVDIEVDGGINEETVKEVKNAGANVIVSGSAFFKANSKKDFVRMIKE